MTAESRVYLLKVVAAVAVGALVLDQLVLRPGLQQWRAQSERIRELQEKVTQGKQLVARQGVLRERWETMQQTDLAEDVAAAESDLFKAVARWARESRLTFTGMSPQWRTYEDGYATLECRANATGDQAAVARFLHEMERDPLAVRLESCGLTASDNNGRRLVIALRFTALRLEAQKEAAL